MGRASRPARVLQNPLLVGRLQPNAARFSDFWASWLFVRQDLVLRPTSHVGLLVPGYR